MVKLSVNESGMFEVKFPVGPRREYKTETFGTRRFKEAKARCYEVSKELNETVCIDAEAECAAAQRYNMDRLDLVYYISTMQGFSGWFLWADDEIGHFLKCPWEPQLLY